MQAFRASGQPGKIGLTLNLAPIHPLTDREEDAAAADRFDQWLNRWWLDPVFRGSYPAGILERLQPQMPEIDAGDLAVASTPLDFLGLNYYFRQMAADAPGEFLDVNVTYGPGPKTAFGWEIYPQGYYDMMTRLARDYGVKDLYLTENGAACDDVIGPDGGGPRPPSASPTCRRTWSRSGRAIEDGRAGAGGTSCGA